MITLTQKQRDMLHKPSEFGLAQSGSFVAVDSSNGRGVWEFYNPRNIESINFAKYVVMTAYDYLVMVNKKQKN